MLVELRPARGSSPWDRRSTRWCSAGSRRSRCRGRRRSRLDADRALPEAARDVTTSRRRQPGRYARRGISRDLLTFTPVGRSPHDRRLPERRHRHRHRAPTAADRDDRRARSRHASTAAVRTASTSRRSCSTHARTFFRTRLHTGRSAPTGRTRSCTRTPARTTGRSGRATPAARRDARDRPAPAAAEPVDLLPDAHHRAATSRSTCSA